MPYTALTRADLRARLQARYESVPFWTDTEANAAINEALCTWGMLTGRWKRTVVLETTANTYELALPSTMSYRMRVAFNGKTVSPTTLFDLDHGRPNWRKETTATGGGVPTRPSLWAPLSLQLIYVWPMDAAGHNSWTIDGVSITPRLLTDGAYVDLAEADVSVLLGFALHVLVFKKGGELFEATQHYFIEFLQAAALENSLITTSQFYRKAMGLNDRSLKPLKGAPTPVSSLVPQGS